MQVEQGDKYLMTKKELENKIATFTGGRAAEEIVFGEITTGASNDIEQATKIGTSHDHPLWHEQMSLIWWQWKPLTISIWVEIHPLPAPQTHRKTLMKRL